jgi:hypothetical protein
MKKEFFYKYECKECNFKTYSLFKIARHIKKVHNQKLTKRDWKFALKWHIISQAIRTLFKIPFIILLVLLFILTYPFAWINEQIDIHFF